jgi:hypothetical protein
MVRRRASEQAYRAFEFGEGRLKQRADVGGRQARRLPQRGMTFFKLSELNRALIWLWRYRHCGSYLVALLNSH